MSIFRYLKAYRRQAVLAPLFKMSEALLELLVPVVIANIIDQAIPAGDTKGIGSSFLILLLLASAGLLLSVTAQYFSAKAAVGFACKLRTALFGHIQSLSYTELDTLGISELITRMTSDVNQVQTGVNLTLRLLLRSPFIVFGAMVMAFVLDARSALIFAAVIPMLSLVVFLLIRVTIPGYRTAQEKLERVVQAVRENLSGVRVIRAFRKEAEEVAAFREKSDALNAAQKKVGAFSALLNPLTLVILNIAVIVLVQTGAVRVDAGLISRGTVVALYNYMLLLLVELIKLSDLIVNITKSLAGAKRIEAVFQTEPGVTESVSLPEAQSPAEPEYAVEFKGVCARYSGNALDTLSDISFRVKPGQTVGIIGATGSGKSTLVSLIARFYPVTKGVLLVLGRNAAAFSPDELRRRIGFVSQKVTLFSGTIRDNLKVSAPDATDEEIRAALEAAQAADFVAQKEGGLDFVLEQNGRNLSGGQRQRLSVARALVRAPEILILDDSTSALDFVTERALLRAVGNLPFHPTVFRVSQRVSSVEDADLILVLDDGVLVGSGTHEALFDSCTVYQEIVRSQTQREGA